MSTAYAGAAHEAHQSEPRVSPVKRIIAGWIDYFVVSVLIVPAIIAEIIAWGTRGSGLGVAYFVLWGVSVLAVLAYLVLLFALLAYKGISPGTIVFDYRVHKSGTAQAPGAGKALLRLGLGLIAFVLCCGLGPIILAASIVFSRDGRGFHDQLCSTDVSPRGEEPSTLSAPSAAPELSQSASSFQPVAPTEAPSTVSAEGVGPHSAPQAEQYNWTPTPPPATHVPARAEGEETESASEKLGAWESTTPVQWQPTPAYEPASGIADEAEAATGDDSPEPRDSESFPAKEDELSVPPVPDTSSAGVSAEENNSPDIHAQIFGEPHETVDSSDGELQPTEMLAPAVEAAETDSDIAPTVMRKVGQWPGIALVFDDGTILNVNDGETAAIGRNPQADGDVKSLSYLDETRSMSKTHAFVTLAGETLTIRDAGSTNGTALVNADGHETDIDGNSGVTARPGDQIRFGDRIATVKERTA